jgi:hypothetical protein
MERILREGGWVPPATITSSVVGGREARTAYVRVYPKVAGDQRYFLLVRHQGAFEAALGDTASTLAFERPGYVYDVLSGRELGMGDKLDVTLTDYTVRVLAVLPYRVTGLEAELSVTAKPGTDAVLKAAVKTDGKPGLHVFRVDVTDPKGTWIRAYSQNVVAQEGTAQVTIPFALNDAPGAWTIVVRDVATGATQKRTISIEPGRQ